MSKPKILLVDDDAAFRRVYAGLLSAQGYDVQQADDRASADAAFAATDAKVVLLDMMLPPDGTAEGGVRQLRSFLKERPDTKIIVVSGTGDTQATLAAVREGAYDFITKPADPDILLTVVARALKRADLEEQVQELQKSLLAARPAEGMIGVSPAFTKTVEIAGRVAPTTLPVLILGENGTGKELLARYIHQRSERGEKPLLTVNCGAVPEALMESTFFGHKKGAFTGAVADHGGLFAAADGGTLFLDEVGDMPIAMQVKLLRALESGEILPVGSTAPKRVDVRIISATNQDLMAQQSAGDFREDLYWRIKGAEVRLPALRERPTDIPLLAAFFLNHAATLSPDGRIRTLSPAAEVALVSHPWPGNLRQLRHEMQRATVLVGAKTEIDVADLSLEPVAGGAGSASTGTLAEKVEALERREIESALTALHGNRTHTAEKLGLSRQGLLKKMARYGFA